MGGYFLAISPNAIDISAFMLNNSRRQPRGEIMKTVYYDKIEQMQPREGVEYATRYLKQQAQHRRQLTRHVRDCTQEIMDYLEDNPDLMKWHEDTPLRGFKKTQGQRNRTTMEILADMINEAKGHRKNGELKDYAMAPIERWNKLFQGTDYEIKLVEWNPSKTYNDLFQ